MDTRFCGDCGKPTDTTPQTWSYAAPVGVIELGLEQLVERIVARPHAAHHLWQEDFGDAWRAWTEVPSVADKVRRALTVAAEDPASVKKYAAVLTDFMADGVLENWEQEELASLRDSLGITPDTHARLLADFKPSQDMLLRVAFDRAQLTGFHVGQGCVLHLKVGNLGSRGLRTVQLETASSTMDALVTVSSPRIAPASDEEVVVRFRPQEAGQHDFQLLLTAHQYSGDISRYRTGPVVFQVGAALSGAQNVV